MAPSHNGDLWPPTLFYEDANRSRLRIPYQSSLSDYIDPRHAALEDLAEFARAHPRRPDSPPAMFEIDVRCFLDVVYQWLVKGNAVAYCPSFESFLVAVILSIDDLRRDYKNTTARSVDGRNESTGTDRSELPILCWDEEPYDSVLEGVGGDPGTLDATGMSRNEHGEGFDHPVLRRDIYEYHRERFIARKREEELHAVLAEVRRT